MLTITLYFMTKYLLNENDIFSLACTFLSYYCCCIVYILYTVTVSSWSYWVAHKFKVVTLVHLSNLLFGYLIIHCLLLLNRRGISVNRNLLLFHYLSDRNAKWLMVPGAKMFALAAGSLLNELYECFRQPLRKCIYVTLDFIFSHGLLWSQHITNVYTLTEWLSGVVLFTKTKYPQGSEKKLTKADIW